MRVGINLLWLVPGVVGGSEEYAVRLLRAFRNWDESARDRFVLFVNRRFSSAHPQIVDSFEVCSAPVDGGSRAARIAAEHSWLQRRLRKLGVGVVHHLGGTTPLFESTRSIVTVHDVQPLAHPENFGFAKRAWLRLVLPRSVERAGAVVTLSRFTRDDLISRVGVAASRVHVIRPGVDPPDPAESTPERLAAARRAYSLEGESFFLYPAITYTHKNHLVLVRALALSRVRSRALLVFCGGAAEAEQPIAEEARRLGVADRIRRLGRIRRDHLDALYHSAAGLLFPSRFEGFGLPLVEAMVRGCPVVAADAAALPEVHGGAGLSVHPDDVEGWAAAMELLLDDTDEAERLRLAGIRRAEDFSWEVAVRRHLELYGAS
ncbi:MAG: hypothetical protein KatS3mg008_2108 [Acidimicrobiales bacterium]|nr:MAG: hypothetical protein KatS3mg008_2108 [Acidimicrobiales bacterium]